MYRRIFFYLAFVSLIAATGCHREAEVEEIVCDTDNAVTVALRGSDIFTEISLTPSPMVAPKRVVVPGGDGVFLLCRDSLFRYSALDGRREFLYGRKGRANNEYLDIWDFWVEDDAVCLFDVQADRLVRYSRDGAWLDSKMPLCPENPFQFVCRLDADHWIGKMNYRGEPDRTPMLGLFDNDFGFCGAVGEQKLLSGASSGYPFCPNREGVLFNAPFSHQIMQVTPDGSCYVKYKVDFPDGTLKLENYADEFALIAAYYTECESRALSLMIQGVCEDGKYLGFRYVSSKRGTMLAVYDMQRKAAQCFNLQLPEGWTLSDAVLRDGKVYVVGFGDDEGASIWVADIAALLAQ